MKFSSNGQIECRICRRKTPVQKKCAKRGGMVFSSEYAMHHTESHLKKNLLECIACGEKKHTVVNMQWHVRARHNAKSSGQFIIDHSDDYHEAIMEIYSKCYDWEKEIGGAAQGGTTGSDHSSAPGPSGACG